MYEIFKDESIPLTQRTKIADAAMHYATCLAQRKALALGSSDEAKAEYSANTAEAVDSLNYYIRIALQERA